MCVQDKTTGDIGSSPIALQGGTYIIWGHKVTMPGISAYNYWLQIRRELPSDNAREN
jgi:hypothetical protein